MPLIRENGVQIHRNSIPFTDSSVGSEVMFIGVDEFDGSIVYKLTKCLIIDV